MNHLRRLLRRLRCRRWVLLARFEHTGSDADLDALYATECAYQELLRRCADAA